MKKIVQAALFYSFLLTGLFSSGIISDGYGVFSLRYPSVVDIGNIKFSLRSDISASDAGVPDTRFFALDIAAGLTERFEVGINIPYESITYNGASSERVISNDYPFFTGEEQKGVGYLALRGNYLISTKERSMSSIFGHLEVPMSGRSKGLTTSKIKYGFGIIYMYRLFTRTTVIINSSFGKNIDPEGIDLSDGFNIAIGVHSKFAKRSFFSFQTGWRVLFGGLGSNNKEPPFFVAGAGHEFNNGLGVSIGFKKNFGGKSEDFFSSGGIVGSVWFSPRKRPPKCKKILTLKITGSSRAKTGMVSEYSSLFTPDDASGPVSYEWSCSDNGEIVNGKWSPIVTVEWFSEKEDSFVELVISNGCSTVSGKKIIRISKNNGF